MSKNVLNRNVSDNGMRLISRLLSGPSNGRIHPIERDSVGIRGMRMRESEESRGFECDTIQNESSR